MNFFSLFLKVFYKRLIYNRLKEAKKFSFFSELFIDF